MKHDTPAAGAGCAILAIWTFSVALSLTLVGVMIWAIITLVSWITTF